MTRRRRMPGLGIALRHRRDPEHSRDATVRAVLDALHAYDYAPPPRPEFRAELREQLVAVAPRIIAESSEASSAGTSSRTPAHAGARRVPVRRVLGVATAVVVVFAILLGGAVWMSRRALPGDSLYGLKRASEDVQLDLTSGTAHAHLYLSFSTTRVNEARALAGRTSASGSGVQAGSISPQTVSLIRSTLAAADSDLRNGAGELDSQARASHSARSLSIMKRWAPGQLTLLMHLLRSVGSPSLQRRTMTSWRLVKDAWTHARSLARRVGCQGRAAACASSPSARRGTAAAPSPSARPSGTSIRPPPGTTSSSGAPGRTSSQPSGGTSSSARARPAGRSSQPISTPPVSVSTCGVGARVGRLQVTLVPCPSH